MDADLTASRPPKPRPTSMQLWKPKPAQRNQSASASGKPGAIQVISLSSEISKQPSSFREALWLDQFVVP